MTESRHALMVRPPLELYERVAHYAEATGRSLSAATIMLIARGLSDPNTTQEILIHERYASH
jgi:hypothetical protein